MKSNAKARVISTVLPLVFRIGQEMRARDPAVLLHRLQTDSVVRVATDILA